MAKQLSVGNYCASQPGLKFNPDQLLMTATAELKCPKGSFLENRCGTIVVHVNQDAVYEVAVKTNNTLSSYSIDAKRR
jgi:hypothetical protein